MIISERVNKSLSQNLSTSEGPATRVCLHLIYLDQEFRPRNWIYCIFPNRVKIEIWSEGAYFERTEKGRIGKQEIGKTN